MGTDMETSDSVERAEEDREMPDDQGEGQRAAQKARYTLQEACAALGLSRPALRVWQAKVAPPVVPVVDAWDNRFYTISHDELERIRAARALKPQSLKPVPLARPRPPIPLTIPATRAAGLPALPVGSAGADRAHPMPAVPLYAPRASRARETRPLGEKGYPPLPAGWVSFNGWIERHGLNRRAVEQEIHLRRKMVAPSIGEWRAASGGVPIRQAYTPEQQATASAHARTRWKDRWKE